MRRYFWVKTRGGFAELTQPEFSKMIYNTKGRTFILGDKTSFYSLHSRSRVKDKLDWACACFDGKMFIAFQEILKELRASDNTNYAKKEGGK